MNDSIVFHAPMIDAIHRSHAINRIRTTGGTPFGNRPIIGIPAPSLRRRRFKRQALKRKRATVGASVQPIGLLRRCRRTSPDD
ncbi:hypothetical protein NX868_24710 [Burkholderia thailandensis]|uniref:hypothetical protein n=1 Tax=Burkholderia thailandensis TaxID=57975 RepID=UPI0012D34A6F|nr:hypothetical protein [Burkholderia thailandensis]MCS3394404.1 hypothetical protein [Burkholderia thailandensis]MCS6427564.1 hypothetical protein [Burkholderia thailandensis]MCS6455832.1 hypothetical protein [Burkholderia thailandensis]MCS6466729.1 hypothetical protein [Burkholderia thailandensis]MCS6485463.1 hypothetical protein [Burkholderia thailandensis]